MMEISAPKNIRPLNKINEVNERFENNIENKLHYQSRFSLKRQIFLQFSAIEFSSLLSAAVLFCCTTF